MVAEKFKIVVPPVWPGQKLNPPMITQNITSIRIKHLWSAMIGPDNIRTDRKHTQVIGDLCYLELM